MKVCIFGASGTALADEYISATEMLGFHLAQRGHTLIFGGGKNGLMGASARGFTKGKGAIIGVAPTFFKEAGVLYDKCDDFQFTETMRDRKKYMEDISDAFIVAPGGIGTYEEFFEVLTLKQLARHAKPIVLFNINGYFNPLLELISKNTTEGFIREQTQQLFGASDNIQEIIERIENEATDINTIKFVD